MTKNFQQQFSQIRRESERAIEQVDHVQIRRSLDGDTNSIAVIMKHVGGNLTSRFTNFLSEDGEKPWRTRDREFIDDFPAGEAGRIAAMEAWNRGWHVLESQLSRLVDADLARTVTIRGVPHSASQALLRAVSHLAYHQGQIMLIARIIVGPARWNTISIPRGGSARRNEELGFDPSVMQR